MSLKPIIYLFLSIILISCSTSRVEDFFVPELPIEEEYFDIDQNEGFGKELTFNFTLFKSNYNLTFDIEKSLIDDVKQNSKTNQYDTGLGMRQDQYDTFVYDYYDEDVLNTIINAISKSEGRKDYDLAQLLVAFVQSIPYDYYAKDPKFTMETLYNKTGDCDDKSILLAKLLSHAGYQTCLVIYEKGQHMAVGLKIDDDSSAYRDGFIYIETTGNSPIGKVPEEFAGGISILDEEPGLLVDTVLQLTDSNRDFSVVTKADYLAAYQSVANAPRVRARQVLLCALQQSANLAGYGAIEEQAA